MRYQDQGEDQRQAFVANVGVDNSYIPTQLRSSKILLKSSLFDVCATLNQSPRNFFEKTALSCNNSSHSSRPTLLAIVGKTDQDPTVTDFTAEEPGE